MVLMEEYRLPINEGPRPLPPRTFIRYEPDELQVDMSDLRMDDFDYLGEWQSVICKDYCGIAYRAGIVEGFEDEQGNETTLFVLYWAPLAANGATIDDKSLDAHLNNLGKMLEKKVIELSNFVECPSITGIVTTPPIYMVAELEELLEREQD